MKHLVSKLRSNTKGFGLIGVLAIVVVVAAAGLGGWLVYHHNHTTKKVATTSKSSATKKSTAKDSTTPAPAHSASDAVSMVQTAYTTALAYVQKTTNANQGEVDAIKGYLSSDLYDQLSSQLSQGASSDVVLCAQSIPDSVTAALDSSSAGIANVTVTEVFGTSTSKVATTVDLSTLKITSITCAQ